MGGVHNVEFGDRVSYCIAPGSYAEYAVVPKWRLIKVPASVQLDVANTLNDARVGLV
jgi:NADPH2:quinone reductase